VKFVLDACALIAYFRKEPGGEIIRDILLDKKNSVSIHALNLCEVYYDFLRESNENTANEIIILVKELGIDIRNDLDEDVWIEAGKIKATIKKISLADCFAITLTNNIKATLLTSDHSEFDRIAHEKLCRIQFIR